MKTYDLIVIGAGSGGLVSAEFGAKLGAKVLLIERDERLGGECLHTGCVPSKALIHAADQGMSFADASTHVHKAIKVIEDRSDNDEHVISMGVDVVHGAAAFTGPKEVTANGQTYKAKKIIISTGSTPRLPEMFESVDNKRLKTNDNFFDKRPQPKKLVIVGAGPIGLEMAYAMSKLGTKVTILERNERVMPFMSPEIVQEFTRQFSHSGIEIKYNTKVLEVKADTLGIEHSGEKSKITFDELLVAAGRIPNLPDGLETAGVMYNDRGIEVSAAMQTSNKNIYAVGDVSLAQKFTHTAAEAAGIALSHALYGVMGRKNTIALTPFATFAKPVVAGVGLTGAKAKDNARYVETVVFDMADNDRAVTDEVSGLVQVHTAKRGRILGAEIVAANADELIGYFAMAMTNKIPLQNISKTIFTYPTLSLGIKQMSASYALRPIDTYKGVLNIVRKLRP